MIDSHFEKRNYYSFSYNKKITRIMLEVLLALLPGITTIIYYSGLGVLINICIAVIAAILFETIVLIIRKYAVIPAITDLSAVVTSVLFAISLPPLLPWWITLIGIFFGIVVVKQLYGGLGHNPFNPAMTAYIFILISYPTEITVAWQHSIMLNNSSFDLATILSSIFDGKTPIHSDAITMATPLEERHNYLHLGHNIIPKGDFISFGQGWIGIWLILGGIFLLWRRVITWHIPLSIIVTLLLITSIFWYINPNIYASPIFHLLNGGILLGAFFIATDPVTACITPRGQLIYGTLIAIIIFIIRTYGGYSDAVAFSIVLMNIAAPTIDYCTQPRIYGRNKRKQ